MVSQPYLVRHLGFAMLQRTFPAGFIAPCLPTKTDKLPSGSQWLHEIKHDGFRKRKDSTYRCGRSPDWLKMKNPGAAAVKREAEEECHKTGRL